MKEALLLMARYNKQVNADMIECLLKADEAELRKDIGVYYKSVMGTLEHILALDVAMFSGLFKTFCKDFDKSNDPLLDCASDCQSKKDAIKDLASFIKSRKCLDDMMLKVIEGIDDFDKVETLAFPGVKFEKPRYQLIMAILNHGIHHRGQAAAALDILKVDNDFSSMLGTK